MAKKNVFSRYSAITNSLNFGLLFVCFAFAFQYLFGYKSIPESVIFSPVISYSFSAIIIGIGLFGRARFDIKYNPLRDSLPILVFSLAVILSGIHQTWSFSLFIIGVLSNAFFMIHVKNGGDYDEEDDKIWFRFNWPF